MTSLRLMIWPHLTFEVVLLGERDYVSEPLRHHLNDHHGVTMITMQRTKISSKHYMHHKRIGTCNSQLEKVGVTRLIARIDTGVSLKFDASLYTLCMSNQR